jgi:hypothetical protein
MAGEVISREKQRWVTGVFFFLAGILAATWSSRIPDVQHKLALNDAAWGTVLVAMPIGLVAGHAGFQLAGDPFRSQKNYDRQLFYRLPGAGPSWLDQPPDPADGSAIFCGLCTYHPEYFR